MPGWLGVLEPATQVQWPEVKDQRSLRKLNCCPSGEWNPPKSQRVPEESPQPVALSRAPGTLVAAGMPWAPKLPGWPARFEPPIHVQVGFCPGVNFQRSLRSPEVLAESKPSPPKSQRLPSGPSQETAAALAPGVLSGAAEPSVPYVPGWLAACEPMIQLHSPLENFHRSLRKRIP